MAKFLPPGLVERVLSDRVQRSASHQERRRLLEGQTQHHSPRCTTMTAEELIQLFEWYDFTDPIGHKLTMCDIFQELVARATDK